MNQPPRTLLAAYDGLHESDLLLSCACSMAHKLGGRLIVCHVLPRDMVARTGGAAGLDGIAAESYCRERKKPLFKRVAALAAGTGLGADSCDLSIFVAESVYEGIVSCRAGCDADMLLIQDSPHDERIRFDTVHQLTRKAPVPVLLLQSGRQLRSAGNAAPLLIAISDDPRDVPAACFGIRTAAAIGAGVVFCHVTDESATPAAQKDAAARAQQSLARAAEIADTCRVAHRTVFLQGPAPDQMLMRAAIEHFVQFVVMRRSSRTVIGSIPDLIAKHSKQNVLFVNEARCRDCTDCSSEIAGGPPDR